MEMKVILVLCWLVWVWLNEELRCVGNLMGIVVREVEEGRDVV